MVFNQHIETEKPSHFTQKTNPMNKLAVHLKKITMLVMLLAFLASCGGHYCPTYGKASVTKPVKRDIKKH